MRRAARHGFTLLEVMVALAILAGSLVAISEIVSGSLRNHVRARQLEVATLLARGKMTALEVEFERTGFRELDQSDEGTFEADGHPEIRWQLEVRRPRLELGPDAVLAALTGGQKLQDLLPPPDAAPQLAPLQGTMTATLQGMLTRIGEQLKRSVREVRLTVAWEDGRAQESFTVVTYLVLTQPGES